MIYFRKPLTQGQDEFRSRLDDTLVIAIIGDYDLSNDEQFHQARGILDDLAQNATIEEESGFNFVNIGGKDESGLAGDDSPDNLEGLDAPAIASTSNSTRLPTDCGDLTDFTDFSDTLSERFATLEFSNDINIATLDDDGKVAELQTMFPLLPELDLRLTLKKRKGDFVKACEDLLNMQYLEENGLRPKGIDGAFHQYGLEGYRGKPKVFPVFLRLFLFYPSAFCWLFTPPPQTNPALLSALDTQHKLTSSRYSPPENGAANFMRSSA